MTKRAWIGAAFAAAVASLPFAASAQDYPTKPVTLVTAFTPGGPSDLLARIVGEKVGEILGQPVVVEGRIGGDGNVAGQYVARAAPDGYTLLLGNNGIMAANMALYAKPGFNSLEDFAPIARIGTQPNVLVVNGKLPVKTVADLVALAKSKPGALDFGSSGRGAAAHLSAALFNKAAGIDIVPINYKGSAPALQDVIAGEVDIMFATSASVMGHVKSGALKALAVTTPQRSPALPDLPTMDELGFKGFDTTTWHGIVVPAKTPPEVVKKLTDATLKALADPAVNKKLTDLGVDVLPMNAQDFGAYIKQQNPKWAEIVEISGVKLD